jgi:hypothetical protein
MLVDMIAKLYNTIPESHCVPLSLYIEGNDYGKPDSYFREAQNLLLQVQQKKVILKYTWPSLVAFTSRDETRAGGKEVPIGMCRPGEIQIESKMEEFRRVGIATTHTNKVANMRRLGEFIEASLIRFHSLFHTIRMPGFEKEKAATVATRDKFFSQMFAFKVTRSKSNNEIFSGKEDGNNDDIVMVTSFLVACVAVSVLQ